MAVKYHFKRKTAHKEGKSRKGGKEHTNEKAQKNYQHIYA